MTLWKSHSLSEVKGEFSAPGLGLSWGYWPLFYNRPDEPLPWLSSLGKESPKEEIHGSSGSESSLSLWTNRKLCCQLHGVLSPVLQCLLLIVSPGEGVIKGGEGLTLGVREDPLCQGRRPVIQEAWLLPLLSRMFTAMEHPQKTWTKNVTWLLP